VVLVDPLAVDLFERLAGAKGAHEGQTEQGRADVGEQGRARNALETLKLAGDLPEGLHKAPKKVAQRRKHKQHLPQRGRDDDQDAKHLQPKVLIKKI